MLNKEQAIMIARKHIPEGRIEGIVDYEGVYILQIFSPDPLEGDWDPFYSVNKDTGEFSDYSVLTDGNINEIFHLFSIAKE